MKRSLYDVVKFIKFVLRLNIQNIVFLGKITAMHTNYDLLLDAC